jgi:DNA invertase Pin-like site-specific DNA recombinase
VRLIEYHRVSTEEQADSGLGLAAQRRATGSLIQANSFKGWESAGVHSDEGVSSRLPLDKRPALVSALVRIGAGEADGIVAMKLDRFCRSVAEIDYLMKAANDPKSGGFALVAMDLGVDTSTAGGKLVARVLAAVAEWERDTISERTKAALAEKVALGIQLGRPRLIPESVIERCRELKIGEHLSTRAIARRLDADGIRPPRGTTWSHSTVASLLSR